MSESGEKRPVEHGTHGPEADREPGRGLQRAILGAALAAALALPFLAMWLNDTAGSDAAADTAPDTASAHETDGSMTAVQPAVKKLAERLRESPDDGQGWALLARSYAALGQFDRAAEAYRKAREAMGDDPNLLVDYADALAMQAGGSMAGRPAALVSQVLKAHPDHAKALWLAGTAAVQSGNYAEAAAHWQKLLGRLEPGSDDAKELQGKLAEVQRLAADGAPDRPRPSSAVGASPPGPASISVHVSLDPALADRVSPDATVFVFARAEGDSPMPVAAVRRKVTDLPLDVRLDDAASVMPGRKLSDVDRVTVGARISERGDAASQPGDLEGQSESVSLADTRDIGVVIDRAVQ